MARILIIEDERNIGRAVRDKLAKNDHQVVFLQSGAAGLAWLCDNPVDLVILDLLMPEMDGFQVIEKLREKPETKNIPIIILSILSEDERIKKMGVDACLTKPYKGADLLKVVQDTLKKHAGGNNGL